MAGLNCAAIFMPWSPVVLLPGDIVHNNIKLVFQFQQQLVFQFQQQFIVFQQQLVFQFQQQFQQFFVFFQQLVFQLKYYP